MSRPEDVTSIVQLSLAGTSTASPPIYARVSHERTGSAVGNGKGHQVEPGKKPGGKDLVCRQRLWPNRDSALGCGQQLGYIRPHHVPLCLQREQCSAHLTSPHGGKQPRVF